MKTGPYDTVIIGGGVSGMMAAITLARNQQRVAVISKGDPVCRVSTGCIDILQGTGNPLTEMANLPENHPYHLVGPQGIKTAMDLFTTVMKSAGLNYVGDPEKNCKILSPAGNFRQTALVPESMEKAFVNETDPLHLITFKDLKDFYAGYVTSRFPNASVNEFDADEVSTLGIATQFNEAPFQEKFIAWVNTLNLPAGKIAVPAVLGTKPRVFADIAQKLGRDIFEIPTLPPSLPGLRLFNALKYCLHESGGDLYWGHGVKTFESHEKAIEAVTLSGTGRATRIEGKTFILATGSFISGGLYARQDGVVDEGVFQLPTFVPTGRDNWFGLNFFETGHEIEKSGIVVNKSFQPENGEWHNLFVCGSILAFSEIMKYGCGHGLAIATGVAAAHNCEEQLK